MSSPSYLFQTPTESKTVPSESPTVHIERHPLDVMDLHKIDQTDILPYLISPPDRLMTPFQTQWEGRNLQETIVEYAFGDIQVLRKRDWIEQQRDGAWHVFDKGKIHSPFNKIAFSHLSFAFSSAAHRSLGR